MKRILILSLFVTATILAQSFVSYVLQCQRAIDNLQAGQNFGNHILL